MQASLVRGHVTDVTRVQRKISDFSLTSLKLQVRGVSIRFAHLINTRLNPECAIEGAILDRFTDVLGRDVCLPVEIGDRARYLQDPIVGACA